MARVTEAIESSRLQGPGGHAFSEVEDWLRLPHEWTACDIPGITVGADDRVYLFTRGNCPRSADHPVIVLESDGTFVRSFGEGAFDFAHAITMGVDGLLYCVDVGGHRVRAFTPEGELVRTIEGPVSPSDTATRQTSARSCAPLAPSMHPQNGDRRDGDLFASDGYGNARVHHFTPTGDLRASWGEPGDAHGAFNIPHSVLVLPDERVLVCDRENNRIQIFDLQGTYLTEWSDLARPDDVCVDNDGYVFVAELGERAALFPFQSAPYGKDRPARVSILDLDGNVLTRWGEDSDGSVQFAAPHGIAVDRHGSVYVSEVREAAGEDRSTWRKAVRKLARVT